MANVSQGELKKLEDDYWQLKKEVIDLTMVVNQLREDLDYLKNPEKIHARGPIKGPDRGSYFNPHFGPPVDFTKVPEPKKDTP